jgi:MFS family permease
MVLISVAHSLTVFLLAAVLFGIGNGGSQPALQTLCLKCVGFERRGASSGTYYMGMDIGNTVGPVLAGLLAASFGYGGAFMFMIVPIVLGMGVMFLTDRMQKC